MIERATALEELDQRIRATGTQLVVVAAAGEGMALLGVFTWFWSPSWLVPAAGPDGEPSPLVAALPTIVLVASLTTLAASQVALLGAASMRQRTRVGLARASAYLVMLPTSIVFPLGIVFGTRALSVLDDPRAAELFGREVEI